jgi:hypothetical protein
MKIDSKNVAPASEIERQLSSYTSTQTFDKVAAALTGAGDSSILRSENLEFKHSSCKEKEKKKKKKKKKKNEFK